MFARSVLFDLSRIFNQVRVANMTDEQHPIESSGDPEAANVSDIP
jgi:hypothetical protein